MYHGTTSAIYEKIKVEGLKPRGLKGHTNWKHTVSSNPNAVYLTSVYAPYFGYMATKEDPEKIMLVEIDTKKLDPAKLLPDEDFIAQVLYHNGPEYRNALTLDELTLRVRNRIRRWSDFWQKSLDKMGTCGYYGVIPPDAMTRVAFADQSDPITLMATDAQISVIGFHFMKRKYETLTRFIFGERVLFEHLFDFPDTFPADIPKELVEHIERSRRAMGAFKHDVQSLAK